MPARYQRFTNRLRRIAFKLASLSKPGSANPIDYLEFAPDVYRSLNADLQHLSDDDATLHFLDYGIEELRPFTLAYVFSPNFYREMYPDIRNMTPAQAYRHWVTRGAREHRLPSPAAFMASLGLPGGDLPDDFSIARYTSPYADLAGMSRYEGFQHFIQHGLREGRSLPFAAGRGTDFLRTLSDAYRSQGDWPMATICLDRVLADCPQDSMALQAYADIQLASGNNFVARMLYTQARKLNPDYFWTLVNGAIAAQNLGLHDEAVTMFCRAVGAEPGLEMPRQRLRHAAATRFNISVLDATHEAMTGHRKDAQARVREAIAEYLEIAPSFALPAILQKPKSRKPRIAMVAAHLVPVCWEYRVKQKQLQMDAAGYDFTAWPYSEIDDFKDHLHLYDVAIFFRLPADPQVLDAISYADRLGLTTVCEIDDLIFDEENYPPPYETFSGLVDRFWYSGLVGSATLHKTALALCDFGIASTPALQKAIAPIVKTGRAFLHRNALNAPRERAAAAKASAGRTARIDDAVTAFYGSGSKSHNENFDVLAAPALAAAFARHPSFRLMVTGPLVIGPSLAPYSDRIEHREFVTDPAEYQGLLAAADINLAPLTHSIFNDCKSEIKWLEAALLGVPSLVSRSNMYENTVHHGVDAFMASDVGEWTAMLEMLIQDSELRERLGETARKKAIDEYSLEPMADNLSTILSEITAHLPTADTITGKKRLLIVNTHFAPQSIGGATRSVEGLVQELVQRYADEYDVEVFCAQQYGRPGAVERYRACGVNVTALAPWDRPDLGIGDVDKNVESVFRAYLEQNPVDLIHFHAMQLLSASPLDVARELGIPYVVTTHDGWWLSSDPFLADSTGTLVMDSDRWGDEKRIERLKAQLNGATVVISPSKTFTDLYRSRGIRNIETSQNGVAPLVGVASPPKAGPVTIGLLGGLGVLKGAQLLYQALSLATFPNLRFIVVDHSVTSSSERIEVWGSTQVKIVGRVPQNKIGELYGELHVILAISVCAESFGLVAREALSLRRWIVASDRGAVGEDVVVDENGFCIDVSSPAQLIKVLGRIDASPDRYRTPTSSNPRLTTISEQADALVDIYQSVLSPNPK